MRFSSIIAVLTIATAGAASPAWAQTAGSQQAADEGRFEVRMEATVSQICGAFTSTSGSTVVDFGDLAGVNAGQALPVRTVATDVAYICNEPNGFLRTISSQNGGRLIRTGSAGGAGNEIPYLVGGTGGDLAFALQQLQTPVVSNAVSPAFLLGAAGPLQVQVSGVRSPVAQNGIFGTTVFAGTYVDTLTISVTAN